MVINVGALKSGDQQAVLTDIEKVVDSAHESGVMVKVILETFSADRRGEGDGVEPGQESQGRLREDLHRVSVAVGQPCTMLRSCARPSAPTWE